MFVEQQKGGGTMAGYGEWMKGMTNRKHGERDEEGEVVQGIQGSELFWGGRCIFFIVVVVVKTNKFIGNE